MERSTQWRSSKTSATGVSAASSPSSPSSRPNRRAWPRPLRVSSAPSPIVPAAPPPGCGIADAGQEPADLVLGGTEDLADALGRQVAEVAAEGLGQRSVRHPAVGEIEARTLQDQRPAGLGAIGELGDEPGLPDARLAREDDDLGRPIGDPDEGVVERVELARLARSVLCPRRRSPRSGVYAGDVLRYSLRID